jgi:8-oxo-dGTP pyrophosphatase MutT (NUDIX family)
MKPRSAVVLIQNDKIALIERHRSGRHYFSFPGGKIQADETPAIAAAREIMEELGLEVKIGQLVAEVWYRDTPQYYFLVENSADMFGDATGSEMSSAPESRKGSYLPVWMAVDDLISQPVLPKLMAEFVWHAHHTGWPAHPFVMTDNPADEID